MLVIHNREEPPTGGQGWVFTHPVTGMRFQHYEYGAFVRQIVDHNRANGIEMENLDELICQQMQLSDRWCGEPPPAIETFDIKLSDLMRGLNSARKFLFSGGALVDQEEANRRAEICSTCPKKTSSVNCLPCSGFSNALREIIGGRQTPHDQNVDACSVCKCGMKEKVWLPMDSIDIKGLEFPDWCWQSEKLCAS